MEKLVLVLVLDNNGVFMYTWRSKMIILPKDITVASQY